MLVCTVAGAMCCVLRQRGSEHKNRCITTASVYAQSSRCLNSASCIVVLMLLPGHPIYSKEFEGSREKREFLLQLRYIVSRCAV